MNFDISKDENMKAAKKSFSMVGDATCKVWRLYNISDDNISDGK
jgi:hypothetical protein